MSQADWKAAYDQAWENYYTDEHIVTVIRRAAAMKANASNALFLATWFSGSIKIEHIHPLESGFLRRKFRPARRPGFPIVPPLAFYPGYYVETVAKLFKWGSLYLRLRRKYLNIKHDPKKFEYMDPGADAGDRRGGGARAVPHRRGAGLSQAGTPPRQIPPRRSGSEPVESMVFQPPPSPMTPPPRRTIHSATDRSTAAWQRHAHRRRSLMAHKHQRQRTVGVIQANP